MQGRNRTVEIENDGGISFANLNRMTGQASLRRYHLNEDLKEVSEQAMQISKNVPGRRNSRCKGPEVRVCLVCWTGAVSKGERNRKMVRTDHPCHMGQCRDLFSK